MSNILKMVGIYILVLVAASACGKASDGTATNRTVKTSTGCPVGSWVGLNYSDRITVGNDGLITVNQNAGQCISTGYVTCGMGQNFIMNIQAQSRTAPNDSDCQAVGTYVCSISLSTNLFTVFCPGNNSSGNKFSTSKEYMVYQW